MSHSAFVTRAFSSIDKLPSAASEVLDADAGDLDAGDLDAQRPKIQKLTVKSNFLFKGKG
jgi:hypothetical protein